MDRSRWARIQEIFHCASDMSPSDQRDYVKAACAGDDSLVADVRAMLEEDSSGRSILDEAFPPVAQTSPEIPPVPLSAGDFGPYRLIRPLGEGGMGVVHLAEREDFGGVVAIKLLRDGLSSPDRRRRFFLEQKVLAQLQHPLIAQIHDAGVLEDGTPWFAMEYVAGKPITEHCCERSSSIDERLRLFRMVCEAVQHAHAQTVIHRDLKPSNILVKADGTVKLLDFGIAKQMQDSELGEQTWTALRPMTLPYASPEQIRGDPVAEQTDVYSLGVLLYELLTEQLPFDFSRLNRIEAERLIMEREPESPSTVARQTGNRGKTSWGELDVLALTAMHKDIRRRYPSVNALIRDVDHYLHSEPLEARADSLGYRSRKFVQRNGRALSLTGAGCAILMAVVIFFVVRLNQERAATSAEAARLRQMEHFVADLVGHDKTSGPASEAPGLPDMSDPKVRAELLQRLFGQLALVGKNNQPIPPPAGEKTKAPSSVSITSSKWPNDDKTDAPPFERPVLPTTPGVGSGPSSARVAGIFRRETEHELDLQTNGSTIRRFRLLRKTPFVDQEGKPIRDSQLRPGDQLLVIADPNDLETAVSVVLLHKVTDEKRSPVEGTFPEKDGAAWNSPGPTGKETTGQPNTRANPERCCKPGTSKPQVIYRINPEYSDEARMAKFSGTVLLQLVVDIYGRPKDIMVLKGVGYGLDEKAIEAVQHWKFTPAMKDGHPVPITAQVEVNFVLN